MDEFMREVDQVASTADFESAASAVARIISQYKNGLSAAFTEEQAFQMAASLGDMYWMKYFHPNAGAIMMLGTDEEGAA
jgi:hypothetical protein